MKQNKTMLNIGEHSATAPEKDLPPVMVNGVPIHNLSFINVRASVGEFTQVTLVFSSEVGGLVAGQGIEDILRKETDK